MNTKGMEHRQLLVSLLPWLRRLFSFTSIFLRPANIEKKEVKTISTSIKVRRDLWEKIGVSKEKSFDWKQRIFVKRFNALLF
jgi:hypothetical protein